jgi:hypothetical protein
LSGAWYALGGSKTRELYTILHLPYTSMVLSYVLVGAALSPHVYLERLLLALVAYFLGLGLSAHALNELHARHWGEALGKRELEALFLIPLVGALSIGAYGTFVLYVASGGILASLVLLGFIVLETFFLFAYNTDFSGGLFHSDVAFAFSWAALPTIISYYVNALTITIVPILMSLAMAATAGIEINLSRWCKDFRRKSQLAEMHFADKSKLSMNTAELIARPERALKLIVLVVDLAAIGLMVYKLFAW